ncbi:MAG: GNAT family N-acetyltransferase [Candidatus Binatia bacterium]
MHSDYSIREAVHGDIDALADIERAAAAIFASVGVDGDFLDEALPTDVLRAAQAEGRLWVALGPDRCVGFALASTLDDGESWLDEIDVHPAHGRRGIGRALVAAVVEWARRGGSRSLGLTTFRDVAWNAPFYASLGFVEITTDAQSAAIRQLLEDEKRRGLPMDRRVAMRMELATAPTAP